MTIRLGWPGVPLPTRTKGDCLFYFATKLCNLLLSDIRHLKTFDTFKSKFLLSILLMKIYYHFLKIINLQLLCMHACVRVCSITQGMYEYVCHTSTILIWFTRYLQQIMGALESSGGFCLWKDLAFCHCTSSGQGTVNTDWYTTVCPQVIKGWCQHYQKRGLWGLMLHHDHRSTHTVCNNWFPCHQRAVGPLSTLFKTFNFLTWQMASITLIITDTHFLFESTMSKSLTWKWPV